MPSRNTVKHYDTNTYYHVYNRGVAKRTIFLDDEDYAVFAHLLKRYLSNEPERDNSGREYVRLTDEVQLVAFCLMPNHFHMLLYQVEPKAITTLIRAVAASYTRYFNKKYDRVGGLFQGIFKAKRVGNDTYLEHITRYIHLNPKDYLGWRWSSLGSYLGKDRIDWVHPEFVIDTTKPRKYLEFVEDYVDYKDMMSEIEDHLANL